MRNNKLALFGVLACFSLTSCSRWVVRANVATSDSVPVRAALAVSRDVPLEVLAVGNVEAMTSVAVKSRIGGQITKVAFEEGQSVAKGQLLFTIDPETLQRQKAEQQAQLERDSAMEQQARALVARDAAALKQSQSEAQVAIELGKQGILSAQRVDQLVTASETARSTARADQAAVEAALGTINADRARLAQTNLQLDFTKVVAPITGRAGSITVKAGNMVRDNETTLVTLLQSAPIQVNFGVPEQILSQVRQLNAGSPLTVEASHGEGPIFTGHLDFIDNSVDATTGAIRLKAVFLNADGALWPGEFVNVRLRLRMESGRIVVPDTAVQDGLDGKYVWLIRSGIANMAPVTVARTYKPESGPDQAVIIHGINPGDTVVTEGQLRLTSGAKITLLAPPPSFGSTRSTQ